jgi:hypothetical protein
MTFLNTNQCDIQSNMTNVILQNNGFIKWNMESNKTCSQMRQNMKIVNKKGDICNQMEDVIK